MAKARNSAVDYGAERSFEFVEPAGNYRDLLSGKGYSGRDIERVSEVLESSGRDVSHVNWDPASSIERLEREGGNIKNVEARLVKEHVVLHSLSKDDSPEVSGRALASAERYAGAVDVKQLGVLEAEELARSLAGTPELRHLGEVVAACAENVVNDLGSDIAEASGMIERGERGVLSSAYTGGDDGYVSIATHYLDWCITMSGLASAYGQPLESEQTLLDVRNSGMQAEWDAHIQQYVR